MPPRRETRGQAAQRFRDNVREVGGRAAQAIDRENARNSRGGSNAPKAIRDRAEGKNDR